MIINGREIAQEIISDLKKRPKPDKILAAVLVGSARASTELSRMSSPQAAQSLSFLKQKEKIAQDLGIEFSLIKVDEQISEDKLIAEINKLNDDNAIGGIIVQLPLPEKFNRDAVIKAIAPSKDADALTAESRKFILPPAVEAVKDILRIMNYELGSKTVTVVGAKGFLVGKPISEWMNGNPSAGSGRSRRLRCKKLILIDIGDDLSQIKKADLVISGVGKAGLIKPKMLKVGAAVIDFGYDIKNGKIKGDFNTQLPITNYQLLNFFTPTPGGTGPILVTELFKNFYKLIGL